MLTTRRTKRDKVGFFNSDIMFDILDDGRPVGSLVFPLQALRAVIALGGKSYTMERASELPDERLYQALRRVMTGGEKPRPDPWVFKDESGQALALAEEMKEGYAVSRGEDTFTLRKVSRPFHLFREGSNQSLGWVGQQKFFTTTLCMNLPAEFEPAFQVFLLGLTLGRMLDQMDQLGRSNTVST